MPKKKKGGKREYCRGYTDIHGQWNNGFYCPKWGGPNRRYCCGTDTDRFCCPETENIPQDNGFPESIIVIVGVTVGCLVVVATATLGICYFCHCCWGYKRRKRIEQEGNRRPLRPSHHTAASFNYATTYPVCPNQGNFCEGITLEQCYPMEDPPPYPGIPILTIEEKPPLPGSENSGPSGSSGQQPVVLVTFSSRTDQQTSSIARQSVSYPSPSDINVREQEEREEQNLDYSPRQTESQSHISGTLTESCCSSGPLRSPSSPDHIFPNNGCHCSGDGGESSYRVYDRH